MILPKLLCYVIPKIYSKEEHHIQPYQIDKHAYYAITKLRDAGFIAYLVGGSVRDLLLNCLPKDFDIATSAKPEEIKELFKKKCILIGRRFRLAHIRFGKKILEAATFRAGDTAETCLITQDNIWGTPEEDVLRRDFTINGLFYDPHTQQIIDYVNGFPDAQKKILKTIGNPRIRFVQDPVRMIRLIKFRARFGFEIDSEVEKALLECRKEITKSSSHRILEELFRMLESGAAKNFFILLQDYGLLELLLPNLSLYLKKNTLPFQYLSIADRLTKKNYPKILSRAILICCLFFPILEKKLEKIPISHLGIVHQEAKKIVHDFFSPFFHLSHKITVQIVAILTHQFRFTPRQQKKKKKIRIPQDPFFESALKFFKIRSDLNPHFLKIFMEWNEHFINSHKKKKMLP